MDPSGGDFELVADPARTLEPADGKLWQALSDRAELWQAACEELGPAGGLSRFVVVADAPRSQFDALRELLAQNRPLGSGTLGLPIAALALTGKGFHGHRERPWAAAAGNVHLSVSLCPGEPAERMLPALIMLPALALAKAVRRATAGALVPRIKWVNDLVLGQSKLAGVLTTTSTRGSNVESAVLGIGLNLNVRPDVTLTPFVPSVCALREHVAVPVTLGALLWPLLDELVTLYRSLCLRGPQEIWEGYEAASMVVGEAVRIYDETVGERAPGAPWPEPLARGVVESIAPDLTLRLRGVARPVTKGRLAFESACVRFGV